MSQAKFSDERTALRLPYAGSSTEKSYAHESIRGFYVFVGRPDENGQSKRWYGVRFDEAQPDGTKKDRKKKLGEVGFVPYGKAVQLATDSIERAREARVTGKPILPTLKEAFDQYLTFKTQFVAKEKQIRPDTVDDYTRRFNELIPLAWHSRPIDEITDKDWTQLRQDCTTVRSFDVRLRKPVGESRFDGLITGVISGVYRRQIESGHKHLENPAQLLRQQGVLSTPKERHDYIPKSALKDVWTFMNNELRAPQRDIILIGLLTGWRNQLICRIPLDRINEEKRAVLWKATDPGGPYAESDGDSFEYPVSDWLWEQVFEPRLRMKTPRQRYLIESNRVPGQPYNDIRDSLAQLSDAAGVHVSAHVLRKTFGTLSPSAAVHPRIISQLMMHKGKATEGGGSDMTVSYQKRDFDGMKEGANQFAAWFQKQLGIEKAADVEGIAPDKLAALQKLADMPEELLSKMLKLADALK